ncbi:MAG TPA: chalcone isomerase family protein [Steroidobacteraceae bacterium]|nr:chalcone isomerase family protein [Steroidobacteraceae bacterium]
MMALRFAAAHGKECEGVFFPDHTQVHGALLTLNGLGLRTASVFKAFMSPHCTSPNHRATHTGSCNRTPRVSSCSSSYGASMTFIRIPGTGMQVDIDGAAKGIITGDEFSKAFLSIWFGEHPQTPELKRGLLGSPC